MPLRYFATQAIHLGSGASSVRAFNLGDWVPDSLVGPADLVSQSAVVLVDTDTQDPAEVLRPSASNGAVTINLPRLRDDFSAVSGLWGYFSAANVRVSDGQLVQDPRWEYDSEARTVQVFDLSTGEITVELAHAPNNTGANGVESYFSLSAPGGSLGFDFYDGLIECYLTPAGSAYTAPTSEVYSPTAHRWIRLRIADGVITWLTSPDGAAWVVRLSRPTPWALTSAQVVLGSGRWADPAVLETTRWDNFTLI